MSYADDVSPDKVAIVTGAGRGFGRAIALGLGRAGCQVSLAARSVDQLVAVASEIQQQGRQAIAVATDITDDSAVTVLVERTKAVFGRIDILINAANYLQRGPFVEIDNPTWQQLIATNLTGPYLCMRAVVPIMREQGSGCIVNISDRVALHADANGASYTATKAGLVGMTQALGCELKPHGIRVNAVCPHHTGVAAEDVAAIAVYLAGSNASTTTGEAFVVGGTE